VLWHRGWVMSAADERGESAGDVDRILKAAWEALRRAGYENMKVKSVIRNAGFSVGSFYRRFSGKQELMLALLTEEARRNTRFLAMGTAKGTPGERVLAWVDMAAGIGFKDRAGARMRWFTSMPSEIRQQLYPIFQRDPSADTAEPLRRAITDGIASGDFPHADTECDAISIRGLCAAAAQDSVGWFGDDREQVVGNVAKFVLAALTNPRPRTLPRSPTDRSPAG
jgi:AcrR family transcriptional regulator